MSLIGIDIGSSSLKVVAFDHSGKNLASETEAFVPLYPGPGFWELQPEVVWSKTLLALCRLARTPVLKDDPVVAMAISASGREVFPVDEHGMAMGNCLMAGDKREFGIRKALEIEPDLNVWFSNTGHIPERMDPVCRILWWKKYFPEITAKARYFLGWHEYLTNKFCGRPVTDRSLAGKWLTYDLKEHQWSEQSLNSFDINCRQVPEICPWGEAIGNIDKKLARKANLPENVKIAVGAFDACCSVLGMGVSIPGTGGLISGTWENLVIPVTPSLVRPDFMNRGIFAGPFPGESSLAAFALNPNGNSLINWACKLTGKSIKEIDSVLEKLSDTPSGIIAIPQFSESLLPFGNEQLPASIFNLSLATTPYDLVKALKESIAFNLRFTIDYLENLGIKIHTWRAGGGGSKSNWWMQLKSDILSAPIELTRQEETGAAGAAILGGYAAGIYNSIRTGCEKFVQPSMSYMPDEERHLKYKKKITQCYELSINLSRCLNKMEGADG